jgi:hypothetical protein
LMWVASIFVWVALAFMWVASIFIWVAFTFMWVAMILLCFVWGYTVVHGTWTRMHCVHWCLYGIFCERLSIMSGRCHICIEINTCFYSMLAHCNLSSDSVFQMSLTFNTWSRDQWLDTVTLCHHYNMYCIRVIIDGLNIQ